MVGKLDLSQRNKMTYGEHVILQYGNKTGLSKIQL